jgi:REP element-mobilizing transposase RayT
MNVANKMTNLRHRRSIRLQGYNYGQNNAYFVTCCTYNRDCLFGEIVNDEIVLNPYGEIVQDEWLQTAKLRPEIELDAFVVMPNHFHGIVVIVGDPVGARRAVPLQNRTESFGKPISGSLPTIMRSFKSAVTRRINLLRNTPKTPIWQRNYFEHILRYETELNRIRLYISANPAQWALDQENPSRA